MKIAVTGVRGIPAAFGGVERHCEELYPRLAEMGCQVTLYARSGYGDGVKDGGENFRGVRVKTLSTLNSKHSEAIIHTGRSLADMILRDRPQIVHIHSIGPSFLSFLPKIAGMRVVSTCHGLDWQRGKWGKFAKFCLRQGERNSAKFADRVICVSKTLREYFSETYGISPEYIPNGVNIPDNPSPNIIKEKFGLERDSYFLFTGRLVPEKGIHYLIKAFKGVETDKNLAIVGGSSHTDDYEKSLHDLAGDDSRIIFTGYRYGEELAELYANTYAYIIPSDLEGLPIALLEAVSYNLPVIASDIPPNVEVIEKNEKYGLIFPRGRVEKLADCIRWSLDNPQMMRRMASGAFEMVKSNFNWDDIAQKTYDLYRSIL